MNHTHIYLSPHLDDAVYSCGARIFTQVQAGLPVRVVSCFTATPPDEYLTAFTSELKERWGDIDDINAVRRAEDIEASQLLGYSYQHLAYMDCVYRQGGADNAPLYPTVEDIFADIHPAEVALAREILNEMQARNPDWREALIYAPLAAGHHVDHLLVRRSALLWQRQGAQVYFYEDYPYAGQAEVTQAALAPFPDSCRTPESWGFDESALAAKVKAAACYRSQISTFWHNLDEMTEAFRKQAIAAAKTVGREGCAENYWQIQEDCRS
ncbi:MAG: PIG-L deacetylase family protein [Anaerolineae bacterium]